MQASTLELRVENRERPWTSVALAFGAGAALALGEPRASRRAIAAIAGGVTLAVLRDIATRHVIGYARSWLDKRVRRLA